jgi:hypothetical protein
MAAVLYRWMVGSTEPVKHIETRSYDAFYSVSSFGSLIQAMVGSFGGSGVNADRKREHLLTQSR